MKSAKALVTMGPHFVQLVHVFCQSGSQSRTLNQTCRTGPRAKAFKSTHAATCMKRRLQLDWTICIAIVFMLLVAMLPDARQDIFLSYKSLIRYSCKTCFCCYVQSVSHSAVDIAKVERTALLDQPEVIRIARTYVSSSITVNIPG